jgi:hypothetical protein
VYVGADTTSVILKDVAFTLYNGGVLNGIAGGARLQATEYMSSSPAARWNIQLNPKADNVQQLSTPYIDPDTAVLYAATTYYTNELVSDGVQGWTDNTGAQISDPYPVAASASPVTITYNGLNIPSDYWVPQLVTDIDVPSGTISGTLTLTDTQTGAVYTYGPSTFYPGYGPWTLFWDGGMIPAGNYKVAFTITTDTNLQLGSLKFLVSNWELFRVEKTLEPVPAVSFITGGYGQANTPISYDKADNIYLGIYEGDRSYYQINKVTSAVTKFTPSGGDDFYGAGAAYVSADNTIVFGSDNGIIYKQNAANFTSTVNTLTLSSVQANAGQVRSSVAYNGDNILYFTSRGTGSVGYIWGIDVMLSPVYGAAALQLNSTSTPVLSDSRIIYVGTYGYNPTTFASVGTVEAFDRSLTHLATIYKGDPVQASPIVWTDEESDPPKDYVYFTTNSGTGAGWCYSYPLGGTPAQVWTSPNTSANAYSVQGMASSEGFVIWGDDGNYLYIAR